MIFVAGIIAGYPAIAGQQQIYRNANWAFSVVMPQSIHYEMDRPPNPNHGFRIVISKDSFVWVNGESTDDASLNDATDSEVAFWEQEGCTKDVYRHTRLARTPAMEVRLRCRAGIESDIKKRVHLFVAFASPSKIGSVAYTIGMTSPDDERSYRKVKAVLDIVRNGFHFDN
jgi:hypothetical protein